VHAHPPQALGRLLFEPPRQRDRKKERDFTEAPAGAWRTKQRFSHALHLSVSNSIFEDSSSCPAILYINLHQNLTYMDFKIKSLCKIREWFLPCQLPV
jgi:hypothetical protein